MSFLNIQLPDVFASGSVLGPGFGSNILRTPGLRTVNKPRTYPLRRYDIAKGLQAMENSGADVTELINDLLQFYHVVGGAEHSWKLLDLHDKSTALDGVSEPTAIFDCSTFGVGDGTTTQFQLQKAYTFGGQTVYKPVVLPIESTSLIYVDGALTGSGWSIDETSGVITFSSAPDVADELKWGGQFYTHAAFSEETDSWLALEAQATFANIDSLTVEEMPCEKIVWDLPHCGGYTDHGFITAQQSVSFGDGRFQKSRNDSGSVQDVVLFDIDTLSATGEVMKIHLDSSSSHRMDIHDNPSNTQLVRLKAGETAHVIAVESSGVRSWEVYV